MTNRNTRTRYPTKLPALPAPPTHLDAQTRAYLSKLSENIEIRQGLRGDPRDRAVTLRELINSGLAKELKLRPFDPNNVDFPGFLPPLQDLSIPPIPTNFTATAGYSLAILFWDFPEYSNHAYTEVWRHDSDTLGDAQLVATVRVNGYSDPIGGGVTRYYWIRHVNTSGVKGPWFSSSGSSVTIPLDVDTLLTALNNSINESALTASLASRIDLIDGADTLANSVNARLETQRTNLQAQIDDLSAIAEYDNATAYAVDDLVTSGGNLYKCILATTGNAPPNATYWELLGEYSSLGDAVANNASSINQINFVDATSTSAVAAAVAGLQSTTNDPTTGLAATRSLLLTDYSTTTDMDTAISTAITGLASESWTNTQLGNYTTTSTLTANYYTKTATDSAISAATTDLISQTALDAELANYTNTAALQLNYYTKTDTDSAISSATTGLVSTTTLQNDYYTAATIDSNLYTRAETDSAITSEITTFQSSVLEANYTNNVALQATYETVADADLLRAQYAIKVDINGRVAGFGLASTASAYDGNVHSEFTVLADRFNIVNQTDNGDVITPFSVVTTPFTNNGVTVPIGTYIDEAYIRNGSITNARIGSLAVDSAKIANLAVVEAKIATAAITTAKIEDAAITTAKIDTAAITSAKIGDAEITTAKIDDLAVDTIKIAGGAVSDSAFVASAGAIASISHAARSGSVLLHAIFYPTSTSSRTVALYRDAVVLRSFTISSSVPIIIMYVDNPGTATYTYKAEGTSGSFNATELLLLEVVK